MVPGSQTSCGCRWQKVAGSMWDAASFYIQTGANWGINKMAEILQTTFFNTFSWEKIVVFWLKFHWNLFLTFQLTIKSPLVWAIDGFVWNRWQSITWTNIDQFDAIRQWEVPIRLIWEIITSHCQIQCWITFHHMKQQLEIIRLNHHSLLEINKYTLTN